MSQNSKTFSVGSLTTSRTSICTCPTSFKQVIKSFKLIKRIEGNHPVTFWLNHLGRESYLTVPNLSFGDAWMMDLLDDGEEITLHSGCFIIGQCSSNNAVNFIITGEQFMDT